MLYRELLDGERSEAVEDGEYEERADLDEVVDEGMGWNGGGGEGMLGGGHCLDQKGGGGDG